MRYLLLIGTFILLLTSSILFFIFSSSNNQKCDDNYRIRVYDHYISNTDMKNMRDVSLDHGEAQNEFIDSLITKEVLLHEAERQEIDKEECFRKLIKNYYEQSLVKILLDRKLQTLGTPPTANEIVAYAYLTGKIITITLFRQMNNSPPDQQTNGRIMKSRFEDLALPLRMQIFTLQPGEYSPPAEISNTIYRIRLDAVEPSPDNGLKPDTSEIRALIQKFKQEEACKKWIADLIKHADVEIVDSDEEGTQ